MSSEKQLTKGQKILEIARCLKDPIYGIEAYLHTEDRTQGGEVPFRLFPRQKVLVQGYKDHRHNIVMKPRQAGISTTTAAYCAVLTALANPKKKQDEYADDLNAWVVFFINLTKQFENFNLPQIGNNEIYDPKCQDNPMPNPNKWDGIG